MKSALILFGLLSSLLTLSLGSVAHATVIDLERAAQIEVTYESMVDTVHITNSDVIVRYSEDLSECELVIADGHLPCQLSAINSRFVRLDWQPRQLVDVLATENIIRVNSDILEKILVQEEKNPVIPSFFYTSSHSTYDTQTGRNKLRMLNNLAFEDFRPDELKIEFRFSEQARVH